MEKSFLFGILLEHIEVQTVINMFVKQYTTIHKRFRLETAFSVTYTLYFLCSYTQEPENKHVRPTKD